MGVQEEGSDRRRQIRSEFFYAFCKRASDVDLWQGKRRRFGQKNQDRREGRRDQVTRREDFPIRAAQSRAAVYNKFVKGESLDEHQGYLP